MTTARFDILEGLEGVAEGKFLFGFGVAKAARDEIISLRADLAKLTARLEAADALLEVAGRKMRYLAADYPDDKETRAWLEKLTAWRAVKGEP